MKKDPYPYLTPVAAEKLFQTFAPWERMAMLRQLPTDAYLRVEPGIAKVDGHAAWCCSQQRAERGLFVPVGHSYDHTSVAAPGSHPGA